MAGTIPLSMTQQLDEFGEPLSGGQLYIIQAGTVSTPQNPYQDFGLSLLLPNPITLDAAGRIPQFFLADGQIKVRLQDKNGIVKFTQDNILVIGPSSGGGGGGGGTVDPTTVWQTADLKARYDTAIIAGFVRANGKTIGPAGSTATELADPSAQPLFLHLWGKDPNLVVAPGGRGATAAADWVAGKTIATPDWRGYALAALDDMGNAAAGRLTAAAAGFGASAIVLGAVGGVESNTLGATQIPAHQHPAFVKTAETPHSHPMGGNGVVNWNSTANSGTNAPAVPAAGTPDTATASASTGLTARVGSAAGLTDDQTASVGGGLAHANVQPTKLCTIYIKL